MKIYTILLSIALLFITLTACSPTEPASETFLDDQKKILDKAKNVEKIGLEHKVSIDHAIEKASPH